MEPTLEKCTEYVKDRFLACVDGIDTESVTIHLNFAPNLTYEFELRALLPRGNSLFWQIQRFGNKLHFDPMYFGLKQLDYLSEVRNLEEWREQIENFIWAAEKEKRLLTWLVHKGQ